MVCLMCLISLFLIPVVNALPLLFYYIMYRRKFFDFSLSFSSFSCFFFFFFMGKVYRLFGWEYRKPEIAPLACPYKPALERFYGVQVGIQSPQGVTTSRGVL
ncbi:hypothetical protein UlMin_027965 [Ulmus minor]